MENGFAQLEYKGYTTTAYVSIEDEVIYGVLEGIKDLVTWEADTVGGIKKVFEEAVDDHLEYCLECAKVPDTPMEKRDTMSFKEMYEYFGIEQTKQEEYFNELSYRICSLIMGYRIKNNLTQKALAKKLGLSRASIKKYESAEANPRLKTLIDILVRLDIPSESIFTKEALTALSQPLG